MTGAFVVRLQKLRLCRMFACVSVWTLRACPRRRVEPGHSDDEQGVGSRAVLVQVGAGRRPVHVAQLEHLHTGEVERFERSRGHAPESGQS